MDIETGLNHLLGLQMPPSELTFLQMGLRTVIVFLVGVALVRLADRRFIGYNAGFDLLLAVVLGSVLSRGINGQASFLPTLGASALLVVLHHLLSRLACRYRWFSRLIKGTPLPLIQNRVVLAGALRKAGMTADDLEENLRLNGRVTSPGQVQEARLERNGSVSVIADN